jgi:hypothetical protein
MRTISGAGGELMFGGKEGVPDGAARCFLSDHPKSSFCCASDKAERIVDRYKIFWVSSVKILSVSASPTDSPKPTNLPFCSAVSDVGK